MGVSTLIVCASDTHGLHRQVSIPAGDILIHAGDFSSLGKGLNAIREFDQWLGELPHRYKIIVPGNWDSILEEHPTPRSLLQNAIVLINEEITVLGLRMWGSPVTPLFSGAFGLSSAADRRTLYADIPAGIDVLVTEAPSKYFRQRAPIKIIEQKLPANTETGPVLCRFTFGSQKQSCLN